MSELRALLNQLRLEEKVALCSGLNFWWLKGVERLGIPSIMVTDGPHGLRKQVGAADQVNLTESVPATCFPTASALAATWNRELLYQVGAALGEECLQERVSVLLGPGVNIKRSPLCGRNFEYFSEDPYLTGELATQFILGLQRQGVGACIKHFAANNQETRRMTTNSIVDERALREIYLPGFEIPIREAQPWSVMCAYNQINGVYASDHYDLMTRILREEWGFQGVVMTDWGALNDRVAALNAGVELEMPGAPNGNDDRIRAALREGKLSSAVLDRAVERILGLIEKAKPALQRAFQYDPDAHHALARQAAAEAMVLLKNEGDLLPIPPGAKVALIGRFARTPRYQGAGSSLVNPTRLENLYDALCALIGEASVQYAPGYTELGETSDALLAEALKVAAQSDYVVICAGLTELDETEGIDREHMRLPDGHNALIETIAAQHHNLVVVLSNGAPVEMPWIAKVPAVIEAYLGGQAGGAALADILTGRVNPSGKLAETFPLRFEDTPAQPYPGGPMTVEYRESIYVGYRYYDSAGVDVLFPFGHGLSYTRFDYGDLALRQQDDAIVVSFTVKNVGQRAGKEVAQVYVRDVESTVFRPDKELKGFAKVELAPGEAKTVEVTLGPRAFAFYDVPARRWVVERGEFEVLVGASSRDIRLWGVIFHPGTGTPLPLDRSPLMAYYAPSVERRFSQADFQALLGYPLPPNKKPRKGHYTLNTPLSEMTDSPIGQRLFRALEQAMMQMAAGKEHTPAGRMIRRMIAEMPMRSLLMSNGAFDLPKLEALLMLINGHVVRGSLAWAWVRLKEWARGWRSRAPQSPPQMR